MLFLLRCATRRPVSLLHPPRSERPPSCIRYELVCFVTLPPLLFTAATCLWHPAPTSTPTHPLCSVLIRSPCVALPVSPATATHSFHGERDALCSCCCLFPHHVSPLRRYFPLALFPPPPLPLRSLGLVHFSPRTRRPQRSPLVPHPPLISIGRPARCAAPVSACTSISPSPHCRVCELCFCASPRRDHRFSARGWSLPPAVSERCRWCVQRVLRRRCFSFLSLFFDISSRSTATLLRWVCSRYNSRQIQNHES